MDDRQCLVYGWRPCLVYGWRSCLVYGWRPCLINGWRPCLVYGWRPCLVYGWRPCLVYGWRPCLVCGWRPCLIHGWRPCLVYGWRPCLEYGWRPCLWSKKAARLQLVVNYKAAVSHFPEPCRHIQCSPLARFRAHHWHGWGVNIGTVQCSSLKPFCSVQLFIWRFVFVAVVFKDSFCNIKYRS